MVPQICLFFFFPEANEKEGAGFPRPGQPGFGCTHPSHPSCLLEGSLHAGAGDHGRPFEKHTLPSSHTHCGLGGREARAGLTRPLCRVTAAGPAPPPLCGTTDRGVQAAAGRPFSWLSALTSPSGTSVQPPPAAMQPGSRANVGLTCGKMGEGMTSLLGLSSSPGHQADSRPQSPWMQPPPLPGIITTR